LPCDSSRLNMSSMVSFPFSGKFGVDCP
jgi:hypothetical protein